MDKIKEAFDKVREDIDFLSQELYNLKQDLSEIMSQIIELNNKISEKEEQETSTLQHINPTLSTHIPTHNIPSKDLKGLNIPFSIGNGGVPTDKQTDKQTDQHIDFGQNSIENASKILDSLDNIKKEIRLKFKRLTEQEWLIFSTIYQLEEEDGFTNYKIISQKLNLTESSIRDYVGRLIKKGIPVDKKKINNKNIQLSISSNLRKIASLNTILQLKGL